MGNGYSQDLRERVIDPVVEGKLSRREAAARFGVSDSSAIRWVARYLQTGARGIIGTGGHRPSKLKPHREWLLHVLEVEPGITLMALSTRFFTERGVKATTGMLSYCYIGEGIRFKKNRPRQRTGSAGRRSYWKCGHRFSDEDSKIVGS
ncbi:MAG: helix-turn-helix domain-containing protein [Nitrospira sp.]|nr:helix-turn-helix domain-containing protein [Nitrospira sp.]